MKDYSPEKVGKKLKKIVKGKVMWDKVSRYLYATDASIYKIMPLVVVQPKNSDDVVQVVKFCHEEGISMHPRGAGSGLGGQALGEGVVLDFTRYMREVIEINPEGNYVWAQAGIKGAPLKKALKEYNKYIPPDPSSEDYATLAGMIANNASGSHSVKYGDYDKWVEELEVVLYDGSKIRTKEYDLESKEFQSLLKQDTTEAKVHKKFLELWKEKKETIEEAYPDVPHNVTGYELRNIVKDGKMNLTRLFVGSEGTLGIITQAKMRIADVPKYTVLSTAYFDSLAKAGKAIQYILKQNPAAIELLGKRLLDMARESYPKLRRKLPKELDTMLLIEFDGDNLDKCNELAEITKKQLIEEEKLAFEYVSADDPEEQEELWEARKSAVPLLYKIKGDKKIIAVIEDAVVPTDKLAEYVVELEEASKDLDVEFIAYGHAAKGLLHNRPLLDMKNPDDIKKMEILADKSFELIQKYGGAISGEHSDGRIRAKYIKQLYGEEVFNIFKTVKNIFDPTGIYNPDVKVTAKGNVQIDNLRFGEEYSTRVPVTLLTFGGEEFNSIVETCIGCGKCGIDEPVYVMCPVYKGKPEEYVLPRAKNNILRGYIEGDFTLEELMENKNFEFMVYNCVGCQQCAIECPSEVNAAETMAEMKVQYMQYHKPTIKKFIPNTVNPVEAAKKIKNAFHFSHQYVRNKMLANMDFIGKIASMFAPISNLVTRFFGTRLGLHTTMGLTYKRKMPAFKRKTFEKWWEKHKEERDTKEEDIESKPKVAYFHGCSANTITPEVGIATVELLEKLGAHVEVPSQKCCGSPAFSYGDKDVLEENAEFNLNALNVWMHRGYDNIVTSCTSCALALKEEYLQIRDDDKAKKIANHVYLTSEFVDKLIKQKEEDIEFEEIPSEIVYHTPCHLRAQTKIKDISKDMLNKIPNLKVDEAPNTCCGISGSWGMKKENYEASMEIGKPLFEAVEKENVEYAVTDCPTCNIQIQHGTKKKVVHPAILLNKALKVKK